MKLLLDTNICIALIKGLFPVRSRLESVWLKDAQIFISSVVLFELAFGVAKSHPNRQKENAERLRVFLSHPFTHLPFTGEDSKFAARVRAELEGLGMPIGAYDLLIAGQALSNNMTLITANEGEFSRVKGLKAENWLKAI